MQRHDISFPADMRPHSDGSLGSCYPHSPQSRFPRLRSFRFRCCYRTSLRWYLVSALSHCDWWWWLRRTNRIRAHRLRFHSERCSRRSHIFSKRFTHTRRKCINRCRTCWSQRRSCRSSQLERCSWYFLIFENKGSLRRRQFGRKHLD